jgi:hypothetical protein
LTIIFHHHGPRDIAGLLGPKAGQRRLNDAVLEMDGAYLDA